jgi:hypothetical protein
MGNARRSADHPQTKTPPRMVARRRFVSSGQACPSGQAPADHSAWASASSFVSSLPVA